MHKLFAKVHSDWAPFRHKLIWHKRAYLNWICSRISGRTWFKLANIKQSCRDLAVYITKIKTKTSPTTTSSTLNSHDCDHFGRGRQLSNWYQHRPASYRHSSLFTHYFSPLNQLNWPFQQHLVRIIFSNSLAYVANIRNGAQWGQNSFVKFSLSRDLAHRWFIMMEFSYIIQWSLLAWIVQLKLSQW